MYIRTQRALAVGVSEKEILPCIARTYSEDEIFNYLQNDSNLKKWKDMFYFKCIPEIFNKGTKKELIFIGERFYEKYKVSYYIENGKIITQTEKFY